MTRSIPKVVVALLFAWLVPTPASAQVEVGLEIICGGAVTPGNTSDAVGTNGFLQYIVSTSVNVNLCIVGMGVSAVTLNVPGSGMSTWGYWNATARRQVPTTHKGPWTTNGDHTFLFTLPPFGPTYVVNAGKSSSKTETVINIRAEVDCSTMNGGGNYYVWDPYVGACVEFFGTPIIVDTGREGYRLTSVRNGVMFDIDGDGLKEQVAWTNHRAENAFLAFDRNGNGKIDNGTELFGNYTPITVAGDTGTAENGFEALRFHDGFVVDDDAITALDPVFDQLLLWTDRNHDGESTPDELQGAADAGVSAISMKYRHARREDKFGNEFRVVAKLTWADGEKDNVYDVWLKRK